MLKTALLAPIHNSLYARLVAHQILRMEDVKLAAIIVRRHLNLKRFHSEFRRDGARLLRKVSQKLVIGDARFDSSDDPGKRNLLTLSEELGIQERSLKQIANLHDIPYLVVDDLNHPKSVEMLKEASPQVIAFTGGGLLRKDLLAVPEIGILNCHTGILPQYRGMDVVEWTAAEGNIEKVGFGATLHLMDRGVDSGPILLKRTITAFPGDKFESIRERLEVLIVELMIEGIIGLRDGSIKPKPQNVHDGRQYFVMHPRIKQLAQTKLAIT